MKYNNKRLSKTDIYTTTVCVFEAHQWLDSGK